MVAMKIAYTASYVWASFNVIYLFSERVYSVRRSNSSDIEIIAVGLEILKIKQYVSPLGEKVVPWDQKPARNISIHWKVHTFCGLSCHTCLGNFAIGKLVRGRLLSHCCDSGK